MEMFYLVLLVYNSALTVIPDKYPSKQACEEAGKVYDNYFAYGKRSVCIPAPVTKSADLPKYIDRTPKCSINPNVGNNLLCE